jgi:hypothetical protein
MCTHVAFANFIRTQLEQVFDQIAIFYTSFILNYKLFWFFSLLFLLC